MDPAHRVVVIGGGFAGLSCVRALKGERADIKLVDRRNFHLFQPLLYQVATGSLSPGDIAAPLRAVLRRQKNVQVLLGEVTGIHLNRRQVRLGDDRDLSYDTLVVAAGAVNHYFGNQQWERHAPGLKSVEDATEIRQRIFRAFELAELEPDPLKRKAWLRFVVVGAGPTGVELAGAISEIARDTLRHDFRVIRPEESEILLVEGASRVLPPFSEDSSVEAERALIRHGVRPLTGARVIHVDESGIRLNGPAGESYIESHTVIWAAGVTANPLGQMLGSTGRGGRVPVGPDLTLPGHPEVFVVGDLALALDDRGAPLPGVAPVAMQQGRYAACVIQARLRQSGAPGPFRYVDKGNMATIGRNEAVAELGRLHLRGFPAWLAWLFIHLMYVVGFRNRAVVALQWALQYITFNRGARLITEPKHWHP
jgi:NADH dehydrogenase